MKYLLSVMALFALASCSHHTQAPNRGPTSEGEVLISIDISRNELRVLDHGHPIGEFKFHVKDPYKNPQCKSSPKPGKYPVVNKDLVYKSERYGVVAHYAIGYSASGAVFLIKEDNGSKVVRGGHCGVMLSDGQGRKLFALIAHVQPKDMLVEIFN